MLTWWRIGRGSADSAASAAVPGTQPSPSTRQMISSTAYGGHANQTPALSYADALAAEMERRRQMRLYGLKTNAELAAHSREKPKRERRAQKPGSDFIGPVSPHRKDDAAKR